MSSPQSTDNWLARLIRQAIDENCCFRIGCTTCGAQNFGNLLMMALVREYRELRVVGVRFSTLHAELLCGAIAELTKEDLPVGNEAKNALEYLLRLAWCALDNEGQERTKKKIRAPFLRRLLLKMDPEIGVRAQTAVVQIPASEWWRLGSELTALGLMSPSIQGLLRVVASSPPKFLSGEQSLVLLDILEDMRSRKRV